MAGSRVWRDHVGGIAWPTLALWAVGSTAWCGVGVGHALGVVPTSVAFMALTVFAYVLFTPLHEAAHGNVGGKSHSWLDGVVGWTSAVALLGPYSAFRVVHLRHHAHTNHPERDPDMWVAGRGLRVLAACATILPHYYATFLRLAVEPGSSSRRSLGVTVGFVVAQSMVVWSIWRGGFGGTVLVILAAGITAHALLAFCFDWLPHHPHGVQGRYIDTRAMPGRLLEVLLIGQNYHLIHHLWPAVPFYRYSVVFRACRDELVERGAMIGGPGGVWRGSGGVVQESSPL